MNILSIPALPKFNPASRYIVHEGCKISVPLNAPLDVSMPKPKMNTEGTGAKWKIYEAITNEPKTAWEVVQALDEPMEITYVSSTLSLFATQGMVTRSGKRGSYKYSK